MFNEPQTMRTADALMKQSKQRMSGISLIANGQVKLWKAGLIGMFMAGLLGAIGFTAGTTYTDTYENPSDEAYYDQSGSGSGSSADSGSPSPLVRQKPDYAVTDFNPPATGTVGKPITLTASVQSSEIDGNISFYFVQTYFDPIGKFENTYQLPGCAWEKTPMRIGESRSFSCTWIPEREIGASSGIIAGEKITAWLLPADGEATIDNNYIEKAIGISPLAGAIFYENFEQYPPLGDPTGWKDTKAGYSLSGDNKLFKVNPLSATMALRSMVPGRDIHSHYIGTPSSDGLTATDPKKWQNYTYSGRIFSGFIDSAFGVTFYSQFSSSSKYYRLYAAMGSNAGLGFSLTGRNTGSLKGDLFTDVAPVPSTWYRFKISVKSEASRTKILAKVWKDGEVEPADWQADAYDDNSSKRLKAGTIGVHGWSNINPAHAWDQLMVVGETTPIPVPVAGDVSGDGQVTSYDASLIMQYLEGKITLTDAQKLIAEVAGNRVITKKDADTILQYSAKNIDRLPILFGDVTLDARIGQDDSQAVLEFSAGTRTPTPTQRYIGDVSADGQITSYDSSLIQQYLAGTIREFPVDPAVYVEPQPDLKVETMTLAGLFLAPGDDMVVAYYCNAGTGAVNAPYDIEFIRQDSRSDTYPDGEVVGRATGKLLAPNECDSASFVTSSQLGSGDAIVRAVVDSGKVITESNEENNYLDHFVKIVKPDLIVEEFHLSGLFGATGNDLIAAKVCNIGIVKADSEFTASLYQDNVKVGSATVPAGLMENACHTVSYSTKLLKSGAFDTWVAADTGGIVKEGHETNNALLKNGFVVKE